MNYSTSEPLCSIPPGSPFCSGCGIKNNCPNTDTGPDEPRLEQFNGFYTDVSSIGDFTLNDFTHLTFREFMEIDYDEKTVMDHFYGLQKNIKSVICGEA